MHAKGVRKQGNIFAMHRHPTLSNDFTYMEEQYRVSASGSGLVPDDYITQVKQVLGLRPMPEKSASL